MTNDERKFLEILSEKFLQLGHMLIDLNAPVDMSVGYKPGEGDGDCGCYGAWCGVLLGLQHKHNLRTPYYMAGGICVARYLGFTDRRDYSIWATRNPHLWDNGNGRLMFLSVAAFGAIPGCKIDTAYIGKHHLRVAENINRYLEVVG